MVINLLFEELHCVTFGHIDQAPIDVSLSKLKHVENGGDENWNFSLVHVNRVRKDVDDKICVDDCNKDINVALTQGPELGESELDADLGPILQNFLGCN